ncbi:MAG: STAS domain-containing protein [Pseudomonadota bacterium]
MLIDRLPEHPAGPGLMPVIEKLRSGPHKVTLDGSRVASVDPTGLEALLVIAATQRARGDGFALENPSEAFLEELALMGVSDEQLKGPTP